MYYLKSTIQFTVAAFLVAASTGQVAAQLPAEPVAGQPIAAIQPRRNAIRLDMASVYVANFLYQFDGHSSFVFPVLTSYERQVSERFSAVVEGLLNGGEPAERRTGIALQGRYYYQRRQPKASLTGFYVAPMLSYRTLVANKNYLIANQRFVGIGALAGWQATPRPQSRIFIDVALGLMTWHNIGAKADVSYRRPSTPFHSRTYYERRQVVLDGRLGVGVRL
ncbi:hypothetical protein [Hymenobacter sp. B1770]|uniref:hypothetical protein n=1 Tax=Hymenobacter sp. B1770 TaxID=1718788 RepID=UPI003CEACC50